MGPRLCRLPRYPAVFVFVCVMGYNTFWCLDSMRLTLVDLQSNPVSVLQVTTRERPQHMKRRGPPATKQSSLSS